jgi:hypothetical protein
VTVFEAGVATNYGFMRAVVNGREVAQRKLFHINLGNRQWRPVFIGADENGANGGPMLMSELAAWAVTMTDEQIVKLVANQKRAFGIQD